MRDLEYLEREQIIFDLGLKFMKINRYILNEEYNVNNFRKLANPDAWLYFRMAEVAVYHFQYK